MEMDITKIARLARLDLSEEEKARYQTELSAVLDYAQSLSDLDLEGVDETVQVVDQEGALRGDQVMPHMTRQAALDNAPDHDGSHIIVPRVV